MSDFIYEHKILSILFMLWAIGLTTLITIQLFFHIVISSPGMAVTAYGTLLGLPTAAIAFWKWRNEKDNSD